MRQFDLSPYYRSTIGFDRLFSLLDQASGLDTTATTYPPYNIERTSDNGYRITVAVAGFSPSDIAIEVKENALTIRGEKVEAANEDKAADGKREVLHRGIAARAFERRFQLADGVQVTGASLELGLLHVDLVREVPEAKKPRLIPIAGGTGATTAPAVEAKKAA